MPGLGCRVHNANQSGQLPERHIFTPLMYVTPHGGSRITAPAGCFTHTGIHCEGQSYCFFGAGRHRHQVWQAPILQEDLSQVPSQHLTAGVTRRHCPHSVSEATGRSRTLNTGREPKGQQGRSSDANLVAGD